MNEHIESRPAYSHNILFGNPVNLIGFSHAIFMASDHDTHHIPSHIKCTNEFIPTDEASNRTSTPRIILLAIKIYCRILFCDGLYTHPRPLLADLLFRNIIHPCSLFLCPNGNCDEISSPRKRQAIRGQNDETCGSHAPFCRRYRAFLPFLFVVDRFINILVVKLAHSFRKNFLESYDTSLSAK